MSPSDFPVFAVREWASRFYEQHRLRRDGVWWRIGWPFAVALVLVALAVIVFVQWPPQQSGVAMGVAVVLAAAAVGVGAGGVIRWRAVRLRRKAARARPATVDDLPAAARAAVLGSPRLRFRRPADAAGLSAVRDEVASQTPVGTFAATVLVWALVMDGRDDDTLEEWVTGRAG
ncbi:hypothetical protein [Terrabacter sp. 2RAF25]|uniref:hypothetical protein n=1 Tax=Terrabacter sp. 2RAF25 TaxID=3232998 RepID=UPI003F97BECB